MVALRTNGAARCITLTLVALTFAAVTAAPAPAAISESSSASRSSTMASLAYLKSVDQPGLCIVGQGNEDRAQLRLALCSDATPWYFNGSTIPPTWAGRFQTWAYLECMGVRDSSRNNGARVQQNDCNGNTSQQWTYDHVSQEIRNVNSGKCVSAPSLTAGAGLIQYDCGTYYPYRWLYTAYP